MFKQEVKSEKIETPKKELKADLQAPSGMHDILPAEQGYFAKIFNAALKEAGAFGYERVDLPILEQLKVFEKGTGAATDIVEKEIYTLITRGGDKLALRPEFTPGLIRAYLEHGMSSWPKPVKLWTSGPLFRHDRPQKGRYRQFNQLDFECINSGSAALDAEVILIVSRILKRIGLKGFIFHLSSIGDGECRPAYEKQLKSHFKVNKSKLCGDCRKRLDSRPLRAFDCKEEKCQRVVRVAPKIIDNLCQACHRHFKEVLEILDELEIPYQLDSMIVRGLDYYTRTVFEVKVPSENEQGSALALGGGGRYDGLVAVLGGRPTPAVGVALGVERLIDLMKAQAVPAPPISPKPQIFLAQLGLMAKKKGLKITNDLQNSGVITASALDRDSLNAQLKIADRLGVAFTLIIGQKEVLEQLVIIREMKDGTQEIVPQRKLIDVVKKKLQDIKKS